MVHLLHLVLGAALSSMNCGHSLSPSSSSPSRLNYVAWKQPPAADAEWLHTKSVVQWKPRQTPDKVACIANHLHQAKPENIESISPKSDEFYSAKRRKGGEGLNFPKKEPLRKRRNKSQKYDIYVNANEKCCQSKFLAPKKTVNQNFSTDESPREVGTRAPRQKKALKQSRSNGRNKKSSSSYERVQAVHVNSIGNNFGSLTMQSNDPDSTLDILRDNFSSKGMKPEYNSSVHEGTLEKQDPYSKIQFRKLLTSNHHEKNRKLSKRSQHFESSDCSAGFSAHCAGETSAVRRPSRGQSHRTTSRREALVRASLITEDRSYTLKMLPLNRVVGLTLEPGSQHRLLLPVERPHGPLSLSVAPCGDGLSWSLTRRPLPKVTETREALDREGQSRDQADFGPYMWEEASVFGETAASGEKEPVLDTETRAQNSSQTIDSVLIDDQEINSRGRLPFDDTLKGETERSKKGARFSGGLSENDVLYEERTVSRDREHGTNSDEIILNENSELEEDDSEENHDEKKDKSYFHKDDNKINGQFIEKYLQKTSGQFEYERDRKTIKNVFSLKNLAFDIGKSDFYDNEANRLLYKEEYDEMLRNQREKREIFSVDKNKNMKNVTNLFHSSSFHVQNFQTKQHKSERNEKFKANNKFHRRLEEVIFEDQVHDDWRRGTYSDQCKFISEVTPHNINKLSKSVTIVPLRKRFLPLSDLLLNNHYRSLKHGKIKHNFGSSSIRKILKDIHDNLIFYDRNSSTPVTLSTGSLKSFVKKKSDSSSLSDEKHIPKSGNEDKFLRKPSNARNQDSIFRSQLQRSRKISRIRHSTDNKQLLESEGEKLVSNLTSKSSLPFRILRSSVSDALTTSTSFQSHSNLDTNSSIASDFGRYFLSTKKVPQNQMKEKSSRDFEQSRQRSYSRLPREATLLSSNPNFIERSLDSRSKTSDLRNFNSTARDTASMTLSEMISRVWNRPRYKTLHSSWRRRNFSRVPPEFRLANGDTDSNKIWQDFPSGLRQVTSRTIWGRASRYDLLDESPGDAVWSYARANASAGVYVITISSSSKLPVAVQVEARRGRRAAEAASSPVTAMVSRQPAQLPVLTISWLSNSEEASDNFQGIVRFSKDLRNDANSGINKARRSYEPLISKITFGMDHSVSATKISSTISSLEAPKSPGEIEKRSSKAGHKQYCLALSEERQHDSLCRARASKEPSIKLGCTRLSRYSVTLVTEPFQTARRAKRYYVTVWQAGSLLPLGQTSLRGAGRGKVPHLRQGVLHKILLSPGGAATAKFRIRKNPQRLHVAAVACRGGLSVTVRQGGPDGLKVVEAGGRSALVVSVRHPPKGLLHLTAVPSTPHSSHTLLVAAATSAKRLPLPRLPHSLTVRADATSCHSGIITWQSAPGRPKYCVLLEEVIGRPKITWPPIQCGWESKLSSPSTLGHCSPGYKGRRQTWQLLRLKEDTTYTITVLITHRFSNRTLSIAPTVLYTPPCS